MAPPYVSVLIDTYNHERFIEHAVLSVLQQDFPRDDCEIIVVDDGSTDGTREILRKFEPRLRVLRKANGGQASAFNTAIPECRGEVVALLDGDDWWARTKLVRVVEVLSQDSECGIVGHGIWNAFDDGPETIDAPEQRERFRVDSLTNARVFRLRKSYLGTSRMTLRKKLARQMLPVPEALVIEADEYLFTMAAAQTLLVILPDPLTYYRQHGQNLYNAAGVNTAGLRRKFAVHTALAQALRRELPNQGLSVASIQCVCEIIETEARQLQLMLDGGAPWDTVRAENAIYRIMHEDAPTSHRIFRTITLIAAGLLPPKWFYRLRRSLTQSPLYQRARHSILPSPKITKLGASKELDA